MMRKRALQWRVLTPLLVATAAFMLTACNPNGVGIFYSLQYETKTAKSSNLQNADKLTIGSMALVTGGSSPAYYIGTGTVYTAVDKATTGSTPVALDWQPVTAPDLGSTYAICSQLAFSGSTLYAVYYDPQSSSPASYLFSASVSGADTKPSWTKQSGFGSDVQSVYAAGSGVFVSVQATTSATYAGPYALYEIGSSTTPLLSDLAAPVSGVAFDGTSYWFVSGSSIYKSSSATTAPTAISNGPSLASSTTQYRSIYWASAVSTLFVSTNDGGVYAEQGGTFGTTAASWPSNVTPTGLHGFGEVSAGGKQFVLVGTAAGYLEMDSFSNVNSLQMIQPGNASPSTATVNYLSSNLKSANVLGFFGSSSDPSYGSPTYRIFALTQQGLWRDEADSSGTHSWALE